MKLLIMIGIELIPELELMVYVILAIASSNYDKTMSTIFFWTGLAVLFWVSVLNTEEARKSKAKISILWSIP